LANLDQFVASLPSGIQTQVGDKGMSLSGGQRQRLFIARELFRKPKLLILDEATSAQDAESERLIQQQLTKLKGNITTVVVSHKIASIKSADIIYVLENGEIAEMGNFNELIATPSGIFSKMAMKQRI
jgi:subfamily B ATP-binding cassette protein MsbA